jgi:hypothetical protein
MANYWKLYKKAKAFYFGLGRIKCPSFNNDMVIFDQRGFKHFLLKSKGKRPIPDQIRRFKLLFRIHDLMRYALPTSSREGYSKTRKTILWSLLYTKNNERINIIVLETSPGKRYFISIMNKE